MIEIGRKERKATMIPEELSPLFREKILGCNLTSEALIREIAESCG